MSTELLTALPPCLQSLEKYFGLYKGQGTNHSEAGFLGELELMPLLDGKALRLNYIAMDDHGQVLHREYSTLAPDENGLLCLWNLNSNTPGLLCHSLSAEEYTTEGNHLMHFEYGKPDQHEQFREQVTLTLHAGGAISYDYAWGLPGEDFEERSSIKVFKCGG